jgi:hypothetical protein
MAIRSQFVFAESQAPKVIPPGTILRLVHADDKTPWYKERIGSIWEVGYYSRKDGLNEIWLVDDEGELIGSHDRETLLDYFQIDRLSDETDFYGDEIPPLGPIPGS